MSSALFPLFSFVTTFPGRVSEDDRSNGKKLRFTEPLMLCSALAPFFFGISFSRNRQFSSSLSWMSAQLRLAIVSLPTVPPPPFGQKLLVCLTSSFLLLSSNVFYVCLCADYVRFQETFLRVCGCWVASFLSMLRHPLGLPIGLYLNAIPDYFFFFSVTALLSSFSRLVFCTFRPVFSLPNFFFDPPFLLTPSKLILP